MRKALARGTAKGGDRAFHNSLYGCLKKCRTILGQPQSAVKMKDFALHPSHLAERVAAPRAGGMRAESLGTNRRFSSSRRGFCGLKEQSVGFRRRRRRQATSS